MKRDPVYRAANEEAQRRAESFNHDERLAELEATIRLESLEDLTLTT